ncbi:energy transducer TonB [Mucilaginibacter sp.]|jgi:TonB family protein|uniref:energy transducer TonB n=1 Tax=Mucilaginibacter sp. TaxID=1882438 RepID=UPI0035670AC4
MNGFLTRSALTFIISTLFFSASAQTTNITAKTDTTFGPMEVAPEFPGGQANLLKFIDDNLKYPVEARKKKTEGRVIITFVVETDGTLTDIRVVRSLSVDTDAEAIRIIKLSPKWKPGNQHGQLVRVQYAMPIKFSLANKI